MQALRSLRRSPVFTLAATLTLTFGIGSVAATFAIAYSVLIDPLPYGHADRLVSVGLDLRATELRRIAQPPGVYFTYRRFARRLSDVGFFRTGNANLSFSDGVTDARRLTASWVTASTIPMLQVQPILGRTFTADEDRDGVPNVAVIGEGVWRTYFQASPDVIGRTLMVNAVPREIIGVMPERFMFPTPDTKLWLPARLDRDATAMGDFAYEGVARLAPGATAGDAQRELAATLPKVAESFPVLASGATTTSWLTDARPVPVVVPLREDVTGGIARTLWMLTAAAGLVLLVALANVANLMSIRADARQLELAVREALGASRLRIATHFLGESLVLATVAGGAALLGAWAAVHALVTFGPADVPRLAELHVGATTVVFVIVVSIGTAIICTLVPTVRFRSAIGITLRDGGRGETASRARQRLRSTIAAVQIAIALVVVAGSVLLLRTFQRLHEERPGFDAANVLTVWTQLPFARYGDSAAVAYYAKLTERVASLPGVIAAGVTSRVPLDEGEATHVTFRGDDGRSRSVPIVTVDGGYFASLQVPRLGGRSFLRPGVQRGDEIVLSRRAVATFFGGLDATGALGRRLALVPNGPTYTVVGVVGDLRDRDLATPPSPAVYLPQAVPMDGTTGPAARHTMALVVRTSGPATSVVAPIRRIVRELDPSVPIFNVAAMSDVVRASTARLSFTLALMTAAAAIALVLGSIGLYGVMAYSVALRTREIGIRIALGADPRRLARGVALHGLVLVASGVGGGLALYAVATPLLRGFLYGITAADPVSLGGTTVALLATAALAGWLPARRAARVDPMVALRAE